MKIVKGITKEYRFELRDENGKLIRNPEDIKIIIRKRPRTPNVLEKTLTGGDITWNNVDKSWYFSISKAEVNAIELGHYGFVCVVKIDGKEKITYKSEVDVVELYTSPADDEYYPGGNDQFAIYQAMPEGGKGGGVEEVEDLPTGDDINPEVIYKLTEDIIHGGVPYEKGLYYYDEVGGIWVPIGKTPETGPMFIGNVDHTTTALPTARPSGATLVNGDYVKVNPEETTFPFTIGDLTFNNPEDQAIWLETKWVLNANAYQSTDETPLADSTKESISGTATMQDEANEEFKKQFASGDALPSGEYVGQWFILEKNIEQASGTVKKGLYRYNGSVWELKSTKFETVEITAATGTLSDEDYSTLTVREDNIVLDTEGNVYRYAKETTDSYLYESLNKTIEIIKADKTYSIHAIERALVEEITGSLPSTGDTSKLYHLTDSTDDTEPNGFYVYSDGDWLFINDGAENLSASTIIVDGYKVPQLNKDQLIQIAYKYYYMQKPTMVYWNTRWSYTSSSDGLNNKIYIDLEPGVRVAYKYETAGTGVTTTIEKVDTTDRDSVKDIVQVYDYGTDTTKTDIAHYDTDTLVDGDIIGVVDDETHTNFFSFYKYNATDEEFVYQESKDSSLLVNVTGDLPTTGDPSKIYYLDNSSLPERHIDGFYVYKGTVWTLLSPENSVYSVYAYDVIDGVEVPRISKEAFNYLSTRFLNSGLTQVAFYGEDYNRITASFYRFEQISPTKLTMHALIDNSHVAEYFYNTTDDTITCTLTNLSDRVSSVKDVVQVYDKTYTSKTDIVHYNKATLIDGDIIMVIVDETHNSNQTFYKYKAATDELVYYDMREIFGGMVNLGSGVTGVLTYVNADRLKADKTVQLVWGGEYIHFAYYDGDGNAIYLRYIYNGTNFKQYKVTVDEDTRAWTTEVSDVELAGGVIDLGNSATGVLPSDTYAKLNADKTMQILWNGYLFHYSNTFSGKKVYVTHLHEGEQTQEIRLEITEDTRAYATSYRPMKVEEWEYTLDDGTTLTKNVYVKGAW